MKPALDQFSENIKRVRDLVSTYSILRSQTTSALELSDILRAALVLGLSAFDHFIHEIARLGILAIHAGTRQECPGFAKFNVSLRNFRPALNAANGVQWLDAEIRERNGWLTFQDPEKVADALRFISERPIWNEVGAKLGLDARTAKIQLKLIVDRRNKIAHEADMDPTAPGARWPIDEVLVREAIDYIDKVARAIFEIVDVP
jgi:hypothetical protein